MATEIVLWPLRLFWVATETVLGGHRNYFGWPLRLFCVATEIVLDGH